MTHQKNTSWQNVSNWYDKLVGKEGHYYHQHVVLPGLLRLLKLTKESSLVDLGCGQGILSRSIPSISKYLGIDKAASLVESAKKITKNPDYEFLIKDVTRPIAGAKSEFSHAAIVLALQNMEHPEGAIKNAAVYLKQGGTLVIVLNHPAFRIPRQSGWGIDEKTKQQYRWMNRYSSPLKIPINMTPGQNNQQVTWSFHRPLQDYFSALQQAGFVITGLEEWSSDKESEGKAARMENRARKEFPLFLALVAKKV
ncbi:MAG: methylase [Patescibacteria group bacterium]|nr:MAG: methylase [Patescibacteria group bacterium]